MEKRFLFCDHCEQPGATRIPVFIDREMGAAGSMEEVWDALDLCPTCMAQAIKFLLDEASVEVIKKWLEVMKGKVKPNGT